MLSLILVGIICLPKEFPDRPNNRRGKVRPRVIVVPISAARFDLSQPTRIGMRA